MKAPLFALLAAITIINTGGCGKGASPGYHLSAIFNTVQTLRPEDRVMMAGVEIGYVESILLHPSRAATGVKIYIQPSVVVKTDSTATIIPAPAPSRCRIDLSSGSLGAPAAIEGSILKSSKVSGSENPTHSHDLLHTRSAERSMLNAGFMNPETQEWVKGFVGKERTNDCTEPKGEK